MPVTRFEITLRRPLADGESFGDVGPYEEIRGRVHFEVDPEHDVNIRVTDIGLAPRNTDGLVEFSSDIVLLKPVNGERGSRRMLFDVLNRGRRVCLAQFNNGPRYVVTPDTGPEEPIGVGNGWLMRNGWTVVWTGWQADPPPWPALNRLYAPEARNADGSQLTGRIFCQFQSMAAVPHFMLSDRDHTPHPAFDLDEQDALMTVRDQPDSEPTEIPRSRWHFARDENGHAIPDADYVHLDDGFAPGLMYQLTYTTVGAPLMGLGFLAMRDSVSFLRNGTQEQGNPSAGQIDHAYSFGVSQSGRFLRTFLYLDLNQDEEGREAFDGIIPHVPGGMRGEFNQRFGQPSKDLPSVLAQLFPFTPGESIDTETEERGALLRRLRERGASLKVFFSNTAAEYWRGDASLIHTDPDGGEDADIGDNVRIYALAGAQHGHGDWPPTDTRSADGLRGQNLINSIDYAPLMRAQLENLHKWASGGVEPPPSLYPRIDDGTAARALDVARRFDGIPDSNPPGHVPVPRRVDFGKDESESRVTSLPPTPGRAYGSVVSDVDADGNEVAGVMLPDVLVPLATSTPWNLRHPAMGAPDQLIGLTGGLTGSTLPLPRTRAEREEAGDPRRSIEERYASKDEYLERVRAAAMEQVGQRYMLEEDIERTVERAAERWDWFTSADRRRRE